MSHQKKAFQHKTKQVPQQGQEGKSASPTSGAPAAGDSLAGSPHGTAYERACRQIALGNYQKALDLMRSMGSEPHVRNAMGVCLLRLGRAEDAIPLLRSLVLEPNCTWTRATVPLLYRCNFATALLVSGRPSGCEDILSEVAEQTHPSVQRIRAALERWVETLTLWQKLNWWVGRIEPPQCHVVLDFVPGELEIDVAQRDDSRPPRGSSTSKTAA